MPTPSPSSSSTAKVEYSTPKVNGMVGMIVEAESAIPVLKDSNNAADAASSSASASSDPPSPSHAPVTPPDAELISHDPRTIKAAAEDPEFAAALQRQRNRELEEAVLMCSLENKEACTMCSG